jgi:hypothetical protein
VQVKKEEDADELESWIRENLASVGPVSTKQTEIVNAYKEIIQYLGTSGYYSDIAIREWSENLTDPYVVATAMVFGYTVVTFELRKEIQGKRIAHPKIPNICDSFNVKCETLFYMMKQLEFNL